VFAVTAIITGASGASAQAIRLKSAGSLKPAFTRLMADFTAASGVAVQAEFGASGTLREKILAGDATDIFTSANMEHPQAIAVARGGTAEPFTRNRLCALTQPDLGLKPDTLLQTLLDSGYRIATSTPGADPAGDYALALFDKAENLVPGAARTLKDKALQLTGSPTSAKPPEGRSSYGYILEQKQADIFLTYCTNARVAAKEVPGLETVELPENLAIGADYGLIVMSDAPGARKFADYILSRQGQAALESFGFSTPRKN
jgi:ABC-type molybdate transport system substrate-binding protein